MPTENEIRAFYRKREQMTGQAKAHKNQTQSIKDWFNQSLEQAQTNMAIAGTGGCRLILLSASNICNFNENDSYDDALPSSLPTLTDAECFRVLVTASERDAGVPETFNDLTPQEDALADCVAAGFKLGRVTGAIAPDSPFTMVPSPDGTVTVTESAP